MPSDIKKKIMVAVLLFCNFYLHSYEEGPRRGGVVSLLFLNLVKFKSKINCCIPVYILMSILSLLTLKESHMVDILLKYFRFLWFQGKYTTTFETMDLMDEINCINFSLLTEI